MFTTEPAKHIILAGSVLLAVAGILGSTTLHFQSAKNFVPATGSSVRPKETLWLNPQLVWSEKEPASQEYFVYKKCENASDKGCLEPPQSLVLSGYKVQATSDKRIDGFENFYDEMLLAHGWRQDPGVAADGPLGSRWGYTKDGKHIIFEWNENIAGRKETNGEPGQPLCPCLFAYSIFWDDPTVHFDTSASAIDTTNWRTYRNEEHGFEFQYPSHWISGASSGEVIVQLGGTEGYLDRKSVV